MLQEPSCLNIEGVSAGSKLCTQILGLAAGYYQQHGVRFVHLADLSKNVLLAKASSGVEVARGTPLLESAEQPTLELIKPIVFPNDLLGKLFGALSFPPPCIK